MVLVPSTLSKGQAFFGNYKANCKKNSGAKEFREYIGLQLKVTNFNEEMFFKYYELNVIIYVWWSGRI
ncbi:unnamed protein product [Cuscuta campestris]|uniref:Uncharacterized protein n=1 Tax=Cuscuta campestris TaxID=132261 RepID=A0A484L197_9ASTE|nr:unnamed protein product [Cuscuta campestris]